MGRTRDGGSFPRKLRGEWLETVLLGPLPCPLQVAAFILAICQRRH